MNGLIPFNLSGSSRRTQSPTSFIIASFPVRIANNFLLKTLFRVSVKRKSSNGVVSVFKKVFVAGVEGELSENVTQAFVGADLLVFARGILAIELIELFLREWILSEFWAKSELCFCELYIYSEICLFALNLGYFC